MAMLREGTKVKTTDGLIGNVEARYDLGTVIYYLVKMEDGGLYKYFADQLVEMEEEPEKAPEEEYNDPDSVTITRKEFRDKVTEAISEIISKDITSGDFASVIRLSLLGPIFCAKTELALFGELKENV